MQHLIVVIAYTHVLGNSPFVYTAIFPFHAFTQIVTLRSEQFHVKDMGKDMKIVADNRKTEMGDE